MSHLHRWKIAKSVANIDEVNVVSEVVTQLCWATILPMKPEM